jgi:hypothetical protein
LGLQPSIRSAVRVVQHSDAFLKDVPPAAELMQLLARYRAQVASGSGCGAAADKAKGKKVKKSKAAAAGGDHAAAAAGGEIKPKKKKKKKGKGRKQQQQPVYLSQMDHLLHTVSDPGVLCELREAEAHDMRQAAARKHWTGVPAPASACDSSSSSRGSRGSVAGSGCSRVERLLSSLSGKRAGGTAAASEASPDALAATVEGSLIVPVWLLPQPARLRALPSGQ